MMILRHGWRSSASRRVRLCLAEKGLVYEGHVVDMAALEHHSPEYLNINPLGVIPTLVHDGRPLPRVAAWWTRAFSVSIESKRGSRFLILTRFLNANRGPLRWKTL